MTNYSNIQGECPKCHGYSLNYDRATFIDSGVLFPHTCQDCGQVGEEYYSLDFQGHIIYDEDGNQKEL